MPRNVPKTDKRLSPEHKAKIATRLRAVNGTPEARAAIAERSRKATQEYNARVRRAMALLEAYEREADRG